MTTKHKKYSTAQGLGEKIQVIMGCTSKEIKVTGSCGRALQGVGAAPGQAPARDVAVKRPRPVDRRRQI